jgi:hypothetical protein
MNFEFTAMLLRKLQLLWAGHAFVYGRTNACYSKGISNQPCQHDGESGTN